jgi:hypothetical protein
MSIWTLRIDSNIIDGHGKKPDSEAIKAVLKVDQDVEIPKGQKKVNIGLMFKLNEINKLSL